MATRSGIRQADRGSASYRAGRALAVFLLRWRWAALLLIMGFAAALIAGVGRLEVSGDYRAFFDADNPELLAYDGLEERYGRLDSLAISLRHDEGDIFTPERLTALRDFTDRLWTLPHVSRVDSIANHQHSHAEDDDLHVEDLVPEGGALDAAAAARVREIALGEPMLVGFLVSPDGRATNIIITLHPPADAPDALMEAVQAARREIAAFRAENPDATLALVGDAVLDTALREVSEHDAASLSPVMLAVVILGLWAFFGSLSPALATTAILLLTVLASLGVMGWVGIPVMSATAALPVVVLTISVADAVHLVASMRAMLARLTKREAIVESMGVNLAPVLITSLTTAAGFLSLNFSDAPPYRDLGNLAAIGALLALLFTLGLLPILLDLLPPPRYRPQAESHWLTARLPAAIAGRPLAITLVIAAVAATGAALLPRLQINDKFVNYFSPDVPFHRDAAFVSEHLPGLYFLEFSVPAAGEGGVNDPDYLQKLEEFATFLRAQPGVTHVAALTDIMKRLNRNMHGDDPAWHRLPDSRAAAAQYLLLYEMSLPFGRELTNRIDVAKSASRVTVVMDDISTAAMQDLERRAEAWLARNFTAADGTGLAIIFAHLTERTLKSMAWGTLAALALIAGCLMLALRSLPLSLLSLLVNCVPILIVFGAWAIWPGEIGLYAAAVGAIALGLIVDFAVHLLVKYQRARAEGADAAEAVAYTYRLVGPALVITAGVLIFGFSTLLFADFAINARLGLMTALVIAAAFVVDMLLLPALLILFDGKRELPRHEIQPAD